MQQLGLSVTSVDRNTLYLSHSAYTSYQSIHDSQVAFKLCTMMHNGGLPQGSCSLTSKKFQDFPGPPERFSRMSSQHSDI